MPAMDSLLSHSNKRRFFTVPVRHLLMLACAGGLIWTGLPRLAIAEEEPQAPVRILFELYSDTAQARRDLVKNVEATRKSFEGIAQLSILLCDNAVRIARIGSPDMPAGLRQLLNHGVEIIACERSLEANDIAPRDVDPIIGTVKSAPEEIRRREENGWTILAEGQTYVSSLPDDS